MQKLILLLMLAGPFVQASECETYLTLKRQEAEAKAWSEVPASVKDQVVKEENDQFRVDQLSARELKQFYLNRLNAAYYRAGEAWKRQELESMFPQITHTQTKIGSALMDSFFQPFGLPDSGLSLETAQQAFEEKAWRAYPWASAFKLMDAWTAFSPNWEKDFSYFDFRDWMRQQGATGLNMDQQETLIRAVARSHTFRLCCKSTPGCPECPLNRQALRPRD
jgi:hypothetical protein